MQALCHFASFVWARSWTKERAALQSSSPFCACACVRMCVFLLPISECLSGRSLSALPPASPPPLLLSHRLFSHMHHHIPARTAGYETHDTYMETHTYEVATYMDTDTDTDIQRAKIRAHRET
ncbi:hypothetical protein GGS21DRAFT_524717 [Xylaria nigripes]|nr:hypothetical protein GGS21DRAFT_524717 [Xylaria nigripes]